MSNATTDTQTALDAEVIVVGGGNAAITAAHATATHGRKVLVLEKAPKDQFGGNSYYTAGATRITHNGLEDRRDLVEFDARHAGVRDPTIFRGRLRR